MAHSIRLESSIILSNKKFPFFVSDYLKVTGDSLPIHEFAYSLFIGLCSVTFDMTG